MIGSRPVLVSMLALALAACASSSQQRSTDSAAPGTAAGGSASTSPYGAVRVVKSPDGKVDGEVVGNPGPKFSKLRIGMGMNEVTGLIGGPDNMKRHETGKRWIPFYFGSDVQRFQVLYRGEGCLTYTGGNQFGGGSNQLIRITATPRTDCME